MKKWNCIKISHSTWCVCFRIFTVKCCRQYVSLQQWFSIAAMFDFCGLPMRLLCSFEMKNAAAIYLSYDLLKGLITRLFNHSSTNTLTMMFESKGLWQISTWRTLEVIVRLLTDSELPKTNTKQCWFVSQVDRTGRATWRHQPSSPLAWNVLT